MTVDGGRKRLPRLNTRVIGSDIRHYASVSSTNDVARVLADKGAADGTVVMADEQTAGRGRYGRSWASLPGTIQMTVILRPESVLPGTAAAFGAVAAAEGIGEITGIDVRIKWPNDIVADGLKIGGVLAESLSYVLLGMGLNINVPEQAVPEELRNTAGSVSALLGREIDSTEVLRSVLEVMDTLYPVWSSGRIDVLQEKWRNLSDTLDRETTVCEDGSEYSGRVIDVSLSRGLVLQMPEGGTRAFSPEKCSLHVSS